MEKKKDVGLNLVCFLPSHKRGVEALYLRLCLKRACHCRKQLRTAAGLLAPTTATSNSLSATVNLPAVLRRYPIS